jgi:hypothetical protein
VGVPDGGAGGELDGDAEGEPDADAAGDADGDAGTDRDGDAEGTRDGDAAGRPDRDAKVGVGTAAAELDQDATADADGAGPVAVPLAGVCVTTLLSVGLADRGAVSNCHAVIDPARRRTSATALAERTRPGRRQRAAVVCAATVAVPETLPGSA